MLAPGKSNPMKTIKSGELFQHVSGFLSSRGIELKAGTYAKRIEQGCTMLTKAINVSQSGLNKAKVETEKKLDQVRQAIHEKTSPKASPAAAPQPPPKPKKKTAAPKPPSAKATRAPKSKSAKRAR